VKSRITRGRDALRKKLAGYVRDVGPELGLVVPDSERPVDERPVNARHHDASQALRDRSRGGRELEVTP
jgi:hypothetical protein